MKPAESQIESIKEILSDKEKTDSIIQESVDHWKREEKPVKKSFFSKLFKKEN